MHVFQKYLLLCGAPIEEGGFSFKSIHIVSVLLQRIVFLEVFVSVIHLNKSFGVNHIVAPKVASKYACGRGIFFFQKDYWRKKGRHICFWKKSCLRGSFLWGKFSHFHAAADQTKSCRSLKKTCPSEICSSLKKCSSNCAHLRKKCPSDGAHRWAKTDEQLQLLCEAQVFILVDNF